MLIAKYRRAGVGLLSLLTQINTSGICSAQSARSQCARFVRLLILRAAVQREKTKLAAAGFSSRRFGTATRADRKNTS
jgi:hypothetical protein